MLAAWLAAVDARSELLKLFLIKHIYQADPLLCPQCGGTMKIIAFIEAPLADLIHRLVAHCGLEGRAFWLAANAGVCIMQGSPALR